MLSRVIIPQIFADLRTETTLQEFTTKCEVYCTDNKSCGELRLI